MSSEPEIKKGGMSQPFYIGETNRGAGRGRAHLIGVQILEADGKAQDYWWWTNLGFGDRSRPEKLQQRMATYVARMQVGLGIQVMLGPAVDAAQSDFPNGVVVHHTDTELAGVYVNAAHCPPGQLDVNTVRVGNATSLWLEDVGRFEARIQEALSWLPRVA